MERSFQKQSGSTQEETFIWNTLSSKLSQLLNTFKDWSQLLQCKKNIVHPNQRNFTSAIFVSKYLLAFIPCDYIDRRCSTTKAYRKQNGVLTQLLKEVDDEGLKG